VISAKLTWTLRTSRKVSHDTPMMAGLLRLPAKLTNEDGWSSTAAQSPAISITESFVRNVRGKSPVSPMQYRLRTLLLVLAVGPPLLALCWITYVAWRAEVIPKDGYSIPRNWVRAKDW
jgi:hypothetical protein